MEKVEGKKRNFFDGTGRFPWCRLRSIAPFPVVWSRWLEEGRKIKRIKSLVYSTREVNHGFIQ